MARWLSDYPEWLQSCWDFVKPPRDDELALQHFISCLQQCKNFFLFHLNVLHAIFSSNKRLQEILFKIKAVHDESHDREEKSNVPLWLEELRNSRHSGEDVVDFLICHKD